MKKKLYWTAGIVCALLCVSCIAFAVWSTGRGKDSTQAYAPQPTMTVPTATPQKQPEETAPAETETPQSTPTPEPYISPVDFAALKEINEDIYGWLEVAGTEISYPLLQSATDDAYYLDHSSEKKKDAAGALFTEHVYNSTTMDDPVTVVYGHHMRSGSMFGFLQNQFSDEEFFESCEGITVYLPDRELHYQVFAAVPYDNRHILYNYDFSDENMYSMFFDSIFSMRSLEANLLPDRRPEPGDHVLMLSTCLKGNSKGRFLVMAKQINSAYAE